MEERKRRISATLPEDLSAKDDNGEEEVIGPMPAAAGPTASKKRKGVFCFIQF